MDKQIVTKKKTSKKVIVIVLAATGLLSLIIMSMSRKKQVNIDKEELKISTVIKGDFEDVVLLNSTVEPKTSVLVNVIQGGSVAEVFVESGQMVVKGTPLLRVYNPNAELNYLTQETAMIEQINNLRNIRVSIKNQQLNLDQQLLSIGNDFENANRQYHTDTTLYAKGVIARLDYEKTVQEYEFQKERNSVIKQKASEESRSRATQLARVNASLQKMQESLELLRKNKENFIVKAPVDGLLSSFNPVLGENYNQGQAIGKIDVLDGFKLVAKVDEYYISKLKEGIQGTTAINANNFNIELKKIHPEVVNGQFLVEMKFEKDSLGDQVRRGMSLNSKLFLSNNKQATLIPKGQFYSSSSGQWVFVLNSDNRAERRNIQIGRENPFYYEILSGLEEGDRVITSSYDDFETIEVINVN
jgi:HlyD family secretion protein